MVQYYCFLKTHIFLTIRQDQRQKVEPIVTKVGGADTGGYVLFSTPIIHGKVPWNSFNDMRKVCVPSCVKNQVRSFSVGPEGSPRSSGERARNFLGLE